MILSCQRMNLGIVSEKYPYNYCNTAETWVKNQECGLLILILCVPRHIQKGREVMKQCVRPQCISVLSKSDY